MAIDDLLDEHEQGERVRSWLRSNGGGIIGGILLGLAAIGGWQWWQQHQRAEQAKAGEAYQGVVDALGANGDPAKAAPKAAGLKGTAYGTLAALALAKAQVDAGKRDDAIATLRSARSQDQALDAVVDQRLARLLIDAGKPQDAIALLSQATSSGALAIRGDAEFAAGKADAARASYLKALTTAEEGSPQRRLLELKLSQVGGAPEKPAANT